jgi:hypothetical protein
MAIADRVTTLAKQDVEFINVGGMAAILRGTPVLWHTLAATGGCVAPCRTGRYRLRWLEI